MSSARTSRPNTRRRRARSSPRRRSRAATTGAATRSIGYQNAGHGAARQLPAQGQGECPSRRFKRPQYNRTLTALSIGGPIVKDKIHFFGSYEGNIQNRVEPRRHSGAARPDFPALDTVNLPQYNGTFASPFRENLFFGKAERRHQRQIVGRAELQQPSRDGRPRFRRQHRIRSGGEQPQLQHGASSSSTTTSPVRGSTRRRSTSRTSIAASAPTTPGTPRTTSTSYGNCDYVIGSGAIDPGVHPEALGFRDDLTYTGFQLAGEHVFKGGFSLDSDNYDIDKDNDDVRQFHYRADCRHRQRRPGVQLRDAVRAQITARATRSSTRTTTRSARTSRTTGAPVKRLTAQPRRSLGLREQHAEHRIRDAEQRSDPLRGYAARRT